MNLTDTEIVGVSVTELDYSGGTDHTSTRLIQPFYRDRLEHQKPGLDSLHSTEWTRLGVVLGRKKARGGGVLTLHNNK